jgi:phospho-N-acetylmuramoyl-pentapeptide-transferase
VTKRSHKGFPGKVRLLLEFAMAGIARGSSSARSAPISMCRSSGRVIPLGPFYYVFAAFVIVGAAMR